MSGGKVGRRGVLAAAGLLACAPQVASRAAFAANSRPRVAIRTRHGLIVVELEDRKAPLTAANFLHYVTAGKYDGGSFFRAARTPGAPKEGTIVGQTAPGQRPFAPIAHESTTQTGLRHVEGTISAGRFAPGSATDGFFICASEEPYLDAHPGAKGDNLGFAAFGQVVEGLAVVHHILGLPTSAKAPFPDQRGQWLKPPVLILDMRRLA